LFNAATASFVGAVRQVNPETLVRDEPARLLLRAASNPATVGTSIWAGALAGSAVEDLITSMTSISAGAGLAARGPIGAKLMDWSTSGSTYTSTGLRRL
jgi:hypothetical protein